jgi:adenosylcobinamide-GDP ribazoletransferase
VATNFRQGWFDLLSAVQFLTRIPIPALRYQPDALSRAVKFFPMVGLLIGLGAVFLHRLLLPHLPPIVVASCIVLYLVLITGCLHEDGLADAVDGFGGGWESTRMLEIMRDSRIGSYGAAALVLSLLGRVLLIASLPAARSEMYLIAAPVLCRWTTLPLSYYLPPARTCNQDEKAGQGARIAQFTTRSGLIFGTLLAVLIVAAVLRERAIASFLAAAAVTACSGFYYRRRIGGVTGDCFGATNQLIELAVYLCGAWV